MGILVLPLHGHALSPFPPSTQRMLPHRLPQVLGSGVQIDSRRIQPAVAQHGLEAVQVGPVCQQQARERMPQLVQGAVVFLEPRVGQGPPQGAVQPPLPQPRPPLRREYAAMIALRTYLLPLPQPAATWPKVWSSLSRASTALALRAAEYVLRGAILP